MLSKSRYLSGLQCEKKLWIETHQRELVPKPDEAQQAIFDQGTAVGVLAQGLFPGGVEIDVDWRDWTGAVEATRTALARRVPLYEAAFTWDGASCRVDLLVPVEGGAWDLYEVKSTGSQKPVHVDDVALQTWVVRGAGLEVRRSVLVHLDTGYVRGETLELEKLFALVDLSDAVAERLPEVPARVRALNDVQALDEAPEAPIGPRCSDPYPCPLIPVCWRDVPERSVLDLVNGRTRKWELWERGVRTLDAIPTGEPLTDRQRIQVEAERRGAPHVDRDAIAAFLDRLRWPLRFLDFESFQLAVPRFPGARPYQQIPFQYSLHTVDAPGAAPRAAAFLAPGAAIDVDPRPALLRRLRSDLGESGSILAFNAQFERRLLAESAGGDPELAGWAAALEERFVDLLEPFRRFDWYHPEQNGSASQKAVLPLLGSAGYDHLEIADGGAAAREYLRSLDPATPPAERERLRAALLAYCGRDTEGMVEIVEGLRRVVAGDLG